MTNLDSIFKSRDITLPIKVRLVKAMVFPVVMYGCESWTVKKAECWRTDAFELWYWRRLLRVPWAARRSNQSILKEISPGISFEGMMLKLKLQYFGHLMRKVGKDSDAGRDWGQEEKGTAEDDMAGWQHWLDGCESEWTPGVGDGQGGLASWNSWGRKESDTTEQLNWTDEYHSWQWILWVLLANNQNWRWWWGLLNFAVDVKWSDLVDFLSLQVESLLFHGIGLPTTEAGVVGTHLYYHGKMPT